MIIGTIVLCSLHYLMAHNSKVHFGQVIHAVSEYLPSHLQYRLTLIYRQLGQIGREHRRIVDKSIVAGESDYFFDSIRGRGTEMSRCITVIAEEHPLYIMRLHAIRLVHGLAHLRGIQLRKGLNLGPSVPIMGELLQHGRCLFQALRHGQMRIEGLLQALQSSAVTQSIEQGVRIRQTLNQTEFPCQPGSLRLRIQLGRLDPQQLLRQPITLLRVAAREDVRHALFERLRIVGIRFQHLRDLLRIGSILLFVHLCIGEKRKEQQYGHDAGSFHGRSYLGCCFCWELGMRIISFSVLME